MPSFSPADVPPVRGRSPAGVGERLREMFAAMTAGPAPAHLVDVVDQLEAQAAAASEPAVGERACLSPA